MLGFIGLEVALITEKDTKALFDFGELKQSKTGADPEDQIKPIWAGKTRGWLCKRGLSPDFLVLSPQSNVQSGKKEDGRMAHGLFVHVQRESKLSGLAGVDLWVTA